MNDIILRKARWQILAIVLCTNPLHPNTTIPSAWVNQETLAILNDCAEQNTPLKRKQISQASIDQFKKYCTEKFKKTNRFPTTLFSFTAPKSPADKGYWSMENINVNDFRKPRSKRLFEWLQKNYTPRTNSKFFYLAVEPYKATWNMEQSTHNEISTFLDSCPLLISCNHPDISWTKKGILIPDDIILADSFHAQMNKLLTSKRLVHFYKRKPKVYFRGVLSGPKKPYILENMQENPRQYLITLTQNIPFLDVGVTDDIPEDGTSVCEFQNYFCTHFSHLKRARADFFEHAKNKYLLSCDGTGAAWGRVELIMATGSILFLNATCKQYFYDLMQANSTHIAINKKFNNLEAEFKRLEAAPALAETISRQGRNFAQRFFTQPAIDAYLWLVLNKLES